jgi:hypothetical protein
MRHGTRAVQILLVAGALAAPFVVSGCLFHHPSGPWMSVEEPRYEQWERATHRTHQAYQLRGEDEQKEYWQWRQSNS